MATTEAAAIKTQYSTRLTDTELAFAEPTITMEADGLLGSSVGEALWIFHYVIIGGGSACCVLAARLTDDPSVRVLLLEAGSKDRDPYIHIPVGFAKMTDGPHIWGYRTTPQRHWMLFAGLQYKLFKNGPVASNIVDFGMRTDAQKRWTPSFTFSQPQVSRRVSRRCLPATAAR